MKLEIEDERSLSILNDLMCYIFLKLDYDRKIDVAK